MKAILFTGIICCLIAAVDAQTLLTQREEISKSGITADARNAAAQNAMSDMDARYSAAE